MPVDESGKKKAIPRGLWTKCPKCEQIIYNKELEKNLRVCPKCHHTMRVTARERVAQLIDAGTFQEVGAGLSAVDPLTFSDTAPYAQRLRDSKKKTGENEAAVAGQGLMDGIPVSLAVLDFGFMGGSMGSVVGEKVTLAIERGIEKKCGVMVVSASGGARMQEGILSLFQMAKTSAALARLEKARLPFFSVVTDPTTGGVTASFAMLGDVILAEPKALVAFAGPRVIEQTIRQTLPQGFQQSEFLLKHGMVDMVVERAQLKKRLAALLAFFQAARNPSAAA
jgi:acetyl-CoA carboxylase carboxyl transferase subunit beta